MTRPYQMDGAEQRAKLARWEAAAAKALAEYGETVLVIGGQHGRRETPMQTLASMYRSDDEKARSAP